MRWRSLGKGLIGKMKEKLKSEIFKIIIATFIITLVFGVTINETFQGFIALIFLNILLEYFFEIYISSERLKNIHKYGDDFNGDYYDLYWSFSKNRILLLINITLFLESLLQSIQLEIIQKVCISFFVFIGSVLLWGIICSFGKRQLVLYRLTTKKQQNYGKYTKGEEAIISILKGLVIKK